MNFPVAIRNSRQHKLRYRPLDRSLFYPQAGVVDVFDVNYPRKRVLSMYSMLFRTPIHVLTPVV